MLLYCGDQTELVENEDSDSSQLDEDTDLAGQYDYLLGMTMWTLTKEKKDELLKKRDDKLAELKILQSKSPSALWKEDLDAFLQEVCCEKTLKWLHVAGNVMLGLQGPYFVIVICCHFLPLLYCVCRQSDQ